MQDDAADRPAHCWHWLLLSGKIALILRRLVLRLVLSRRICLLAAVLLRGRRLSACARLAGRSPRAALVLARRRLVFVSLCIPADTSGQSQGAHRPRVDAAGGLEALLALEADQGLSRFRPEYSVNPAVEEAAVDENPLNFADLRFAEIRLLSTSLLRCRPARSARATCRHDVDNSVAMVDDDDFVFDNEETVIAVSWEDLNKSRKVETPTT